MKQLPRTRHLLGTVAALALVGLLPLSGVSPASAGMEYYREVSEPRIVGQARIAHQVLDRERPAQPAPSPTPTPSPSPSPSGTPAPSTTTTPSADVVLHVDQAHAKASDGGPGTAEAPLSTLGEAVRRADLKNRAGDSVRVVVAAGVYREELQLGTYRSTDAPVTIEGVGDVVVSGSEVYRDWSGSGAIRTHPWRFDWGVRAVPDAWLTGYGAEHLEANPVIRRSEMVFVNGALMTPHTSLAAMESQPGSFYVDEAADRLYLHAPEGVDLSRATVEVAERESVIRIGQRSNVTIRGLRLVHAASDVQGRAIVIGNSSGITLEDLVVEWNSWGGIGMSKSQGVTIRKVRADHNGVAGMTGYWLDDLLVEDSTTNRNGWRGARGLEAIDTSHHLDRTFVDYAGGQKFLNIHGATFRRHTSTGNLASGLWFDSHNRDIVVEHSVFDDNLTWGLFFEASDGPLVVRDSRMCRNETGLVIANSEQGAVLRNTIGSNPEGEVWLSGRHERWINFRDGGGDHLTSQNWSFAGNRIGSSDGDGVFVTKLENEGWDAFRSSLSSDGNTWSSVSRADPWRMARGRYIDLATWRSETGGDATSTFSRNGPPC